MQIVTSVEFTLPENTTVIDVFFKETPLKKLLTRNYLRVGLIMMDITKRNRIKNAGEYRVVYSRWNNYKIYRIER